MQSSRKYGRKYSPVTYYEPEDFIKSIHGNFDNPLQKRPTSPLFTLDVDFLTGTDCREPTYCAACCPEALR